MLLPGNEHSFHFKEQCKATHEWYEGDFTVKCLLTNEEQSEIALRTDRYNQGSKTLAPSFALFNRTLAELEMRIIKAPTWWRESDSGRTLYDADIVYSVFKEAMKGPEEWAKRLEAKTKAAKEAEKKTEKEVG
jgi:hypothetical protein